MAIASYAPKRRPARRCALAERVDQLLPVALLGENDLTAVGKGKTRAVGNFAPNVTNILPCVAASSPMAESAVNNFSARSQRARARASR
jgi:hypothetical protein